MNGFVVIIKKVCCVLLYINRNCIALCQQLFLTTVEYAMTSVVSNLNLIFYVCFFILVVLVVCLSHVNSLC